MIFYIIQWFWREDGPWQDSLYLEGDEALSLIGMTRGDGWC